MIPLPKSYLLERNTIIERLNVGSKVHSKDLIP